MKSLEGILCARSQRFGTNNRDIVIESVCEYGKKKAGVYCERCPNRTGGT